MAANTLPSGIGDLFYLGARVVDATRLHGPWVFQNRTTVDNIEPYLKAAISAEDEFTQARAAKATAAVRFAEADAELTAWLAKARLVVMLAYGSKWSESWVAAGFTHRGTNVPKCIRPRIELSRRIASFFRDRPEYEVPFANVTAATAAALQEKIESADRDVRLTTRAAADRKRTRDRAEAALRCWLGVIRAILHGTLKPSDPRWQDFGFNTPRPDAKPERDAHFERLGGAEPVAVDFSTPSELPQPGAAVA